MPGDESTKGGASTTRIDAAYIIAFDGAEHRLVQDGSLVYQGDTITYVGPRTTAPADHVLDLGQRIVAPGFITLHSHLCDSPLTKSFREDSGREQLWMSGLYEHLLPLGMASTEETRAAAIRFSVFEVLRSGTTTVVDITYGAPEATAEAATAIGLRAYVAPLFRSASWRLEGGHRVAYDWLDEAEENAIFERAVEFVSHYASADGLVRSMLAPAQVDTCRPELLARTKDAAERLGVPIQIHAGQAVVEFHEMVRRHGRTPVGFLADVGLLGPDLIIGHCIFTGGHSWLSYPSDEDLSLLSASGTHVAHCPWVFARYGIALESMPRYARAGIRMGIGTDTAPQSMLLELRVAATMAKLIERDAELGTAREVFDAATLGGAAALSRDDLGRLAPGARADFVCYRTDTVSMAPLRDPLRNIVYCALPTDVDRVVVAGRDVLVDGQDRKSVV